MDHQHQHQKPHNNNSVSTLSCVEGKDRHDSFLDEPELLQTQAQRPNTRDLLRPLHLLTPGDDDDNDSIANGSFDDFCCSDNDADPSLPLMLRLLFGLNGLSLSLLTLPIMYILNTRVAVPLPYLPAYGAIAFLPYSLKPLYAYLCGLWATPSSKAIPQRSDTIESIQNQHDNNNNHHSYLSLFRWLLATNSICTLLFAVIPNGGVVAVFIVAFLRGITDSWAEFCLGLTLIDHARADASHNKNKYETTVSGLQTQAATAGNLGSWLASLLICLVLVWRRVASEHESVETEQQPQLTGALANGLVIATSIVQLAGAVFVHFWEKRQSNRSCMYEEITTETRRPIDNNVSPFVFPTESDSFRDEERSHPSYSSLEDLADDEDSTSLSTDSSSFINRDSNSSPSLRKIANLALVILLQCVLVVIALKGPIVEVSSHFVWGILVTTLFVGIITASIAICCKVGNNNNNNNNVSSTSSNAKVDNNMTTFRVGLFLVLKNAIPSDSAILASFFYSLFGANQPLLFQFLSFLGMGVSSLSSWSYTRLFSKRFGSGRPLVGLMAGTAALASLAALVHIAVFRIYQTSNTDDGDGDTSFPSRKLLLMAIVSKFVTTFFDEWAFLPELVLATTSVKVSAMTKPSTTLLITNTSSSSPTEAIDDREVGTQSCSAILSNTLSHHDSCENIHNDNDDQQQQQRIAMEYGTLVSCIDFGDQLGSLLAAPLVAFWQISRENGFLHLDRLIVFCSVANLVFTIGILPLLWNSGQKTKR